jgi:NAD(P)-dependent dehydrogenase (short-subunit alcohol dehydrogenase family)
MSDQIAVITGAGQGAGRTIALRFAAQGFRVVLLGRTEAKLRAVAQEIGASASHYALDLTNSHQVQTFMEYAQQHYDHVDVLVNCAGEAFISPLDQSSEEDIDRILAIDLKAPIMMARGLLPLLRKSANASSINILSKVSLAGYPQVSIYTAAKTGLLGFTKSLAAELRDDGIRVGAVCPGAMDTPMRWSASPDIDRKLVINPVHIADMVWHIANMPKGVMTGEILLQSIYYQ